MNPSKVTESASIDNLTLLRRIWLFIMLTLLLELGLAIAILGMITNTRNGEHKTNFFEHFCNTVLGQYSNRIPYLFCRKSSTVHYQEPRPNTKTKQKNRHMHSISV
jgi:hypothetical protein